jgi:Putative lumazine-binding
MKISIAILVLSATLVYGQKKNEDAIMLPINNLFLGLEKGDSALLQTALMKEFSITVVQEKDGKTIFRKSSRQEFLNTVGSPHPEPWHEPIWNVKVQQDGNFAQVWASYAFYIGSTFSHCGVDTFQLMKTDNGWKIFYLAYTTRKSDCNVPKEIAGRYGKK